MAFGYLDQEKFNELKINYWDFRNDGKYRELIFPTF